jgi:predicted ATP-dependent serine protease
MTQPIIASTLLQACPPLSERDISTKRIGSGFESLDEVLQGGVLSGHITAISGEHGTGKTLVSCPSSTAGSWNFYVKTIDLA